MTDLKLYYSPGACSLASHILLEESGLPYSTQVVNVQKGFPDEFKHINPKGRVPILVLNQQTITESPAIMLAISQLVPDKNLFGTTDIERVRVAEWMNWLSGTVHAQAFGGWFRSARFTDDPSMHDAIRAKSRQTVLDCFQAIEEQLTGLHAVGDRFTAVDGFLYVFYRWGVGKEERMADYPKYSALVAELYKRPAVKKVVEDEGIEARVS